MKKVLGLIFVAVFAVVSFAGQLSLSAADGPYTFEFVDSTKAVHDVTGTASDTLFKDIPIKWGYGYAMVVYDSIVSDSVAIKVYTKNKPKGSILGYAIPDNVSSADATNPYVTIDLGIGNTVCGNYFTVFFSGLNATTVKRIKRASIYQYKKMLWTIPYNAKQ